MGMILFAFGLFVAGAALGWAVMLIADLLHKEDNAAEMLQTSFLFSGNLKQTGIVDAVQFLEIGKREGILHVYCGRRKGYITFFKGKVIDAFYRDLVGREAMFAMMDLEEGDFYFEPKVIEQPRLISDSIIDIVMTFDAARNRGEHFST